MAVPAEEAPARHDCQGVNVKKLVVRLLKFVEFLLVKTPPLWAGMAIIFGGALGFAAMVATNQRAAFCMKCHATDGIFISFDEKSKEHKPYKEQRLGCVKCHTDKDFYQVTTRTFARVSAQVLRDTNEEVSRLPAAKAGYTDIDCLTCHQGILEVKDGVALELPAKTAAIGLRFSHEQHYWLASFPDEAKDRLRERRAATTLSKEEAEELAFLTDKVELGWCGQCHDRVQATSAGGEQLNRTINYFSDNPMQCTGCHTDAVRATHPGTIHLALPTEETCRRCHTGTFHGRFTTFRAECEGKDQQHCVKCHPLWRPAATAAAGGKP